MITGLAHECCNIVKGDGITEKGSSTLSVGGTNKQACSLDGT